MKKALPKPKLPNGSNAPMASLALQFLKLAVRQLSDGAVTMSFITFFLAKKTLIKGLLCLLYMRKKNV